MILLPLIYFIGLVKENIGRVSFIVDLAVIIGINSINLFILFLAIFIFLEYATAFKQEQNILLSFFLALYLLILFLTVFLKKLSRKKSDNISEVPLLFSLFFAPFIAWYSRFKIFTTPKNRLTKPIFYKNIEGIKTIINIGIGKLTNRKNTKEVLTVKKQIETSLKTTKQEPISKPQKTKLDKKGGSLYQKALEFNRLKQYDTSLIFLNRALELSNNDDYLLLVKIYRAMGIALEGKEDFNTALFCYNKAMYISVEFLEDRYPVTRYKIALEKIESLGKKKYKYLPNEP